MFSPSEPASTTRRGADSLGTRLMILSKFLISIIPASLYSVFAAAHRDLILIIKEGLREYKNILRLSKKSFCQAGANVELSQTFKI